MPSSGFRLILTLISPKSGIKIGKLVGNQPYMPTSPVSSFIQKFPFKTHAGPGGAFLPAGKFLAGQRLAAPTFLLKGYAGTGKTTIVCTWWT
jgi:hypothetical protein